MPCHLLFENWILVSRYRSWVSYLCFSSQILIWNSHAVVLFLFCDNNSFEFLDIFSTFYKPLHFFYYYYYSFVYLNGQCTNDLYIALFYLEKIMYFYFFLFNHLWIFLQFISFTIRGMLNVFSEGSEDETTKNIQKSLGEFTIFHLFIFFLLEIVALRLSFYLN